jgi:hypothetical protein
MKDFDRSAQARQLGDLIRSTKILPKRSLPEPEIRRRVQLLSS